MKRPDPTLRYGHGVKLAPAGFNPVSDGPGTHIEHLRPLRNCQQQAVRRNTSRPQFGVWAGGNGGSIRPPSLASRSHGVVADARLFGSLRQGERCVHNECDVVSFVGTLLRLCGPATVSPLVVTIHINSLDGHVIWAITHVGQEAQEGISPLFANENTSSSVVIEPCGRGYVAPGYHAFPYTVGLCPAQAVSSKPGCISFPLHAATRLGIPHEVTSRHLLARAAIAKNIPDKLPVPVFVGKRFHRKAPKSLSGKVVHWGAPMNFMCGLYRTLKEAA